MKKVIIAAIALIVCVAAALTVYFKVIKKPAVDIPTTTQNGVQQFESVSNTEGKSSKGSIIGVWVGATDNEFYYSFNNDKTGSFTMGDEVKTFTYKDNGDSVTIVFDGSTKEHIFKYTVENSVLSIENDYGVTEKYNWK